jgi:aminodeoxyfutalosine synthase
MTAESSLRQIEEKVGAGERLDFDDGLRLCGDSDLLAVGQLANRVRERLHGNATYYNRNLHLNVTNVCQADCPFCSFARLEEGMPRAYTMSHAEALQWIEARYQPGMTEIHIVNGLHPRLPLEYYTELLRQIRNRFPALHLKAFTAVEIHFFAEKFGLSYDEVLKRLIACGLGSLPGGGAEIFAERVRLKICRDKVDAAGWLEVHRAAHRLGLKSNCTMLYGTVERTAERVDHLLRLRRLQDETGGFQAFIPLAFHPAGTRLAHLPKPTGLDDLRAIAVSRLVLDNFDHIKAYWISLGVGTAQTALAYGADDLDGTVRHEAIHHDAGSTAPEVLSVDELRALIVEAGREPVERDSLYRRAGGKHVC